MIKSSKEKMLEKRISYLEKKLKLKSRKFENANSEFAQILLGFFYEEGWEAAKDIMDICVEVMTDDQLKDVCLKYSNESEEELLDRYENNRYTF